MSRFLAGIPEVRVITCHIPSDESDKGAADMQREVNADLHDNAGAPGQPRCEGA